MKLKDKQKRTARVTDEPFLIQPGLLGTALASPRRRAAAFIVDLALWVIAGLTLMLLINAFLLYWSYPAVYTAIRDGIGETPAAEKQHARYLLKKEMLRLFDYRKPHLLSKNLKKALDNNDDNALQEQLRDYSLFFDLDYSGAKESEIDYSTSRMVIRPDLFIGGFNVMLNLGAIFLLYFTLFTWLSQGRTPGKWLMGIRVVRLDGKPIRLWDAFGRAGGYSASFSTLGIGFLEAIWHPNRQTVHDRISSTVVIMNLPQAQ